MCSSNSFVNSIPIGVCALRSCVPVLLLGTCLLLRNGLQRVVSDSLLCRLAHQQQRRQSGGKRGRGQMLQQWLLPLWLCCWPTWTLPCQSLLKPTCKIMLRMKKTCRWTFVGHSHVVSQQLHRCFTPSTAVVHRSDAPAHYAVCQGNIKALLCSACSCLYALLRLNQGCLLCGA